MIARTLRHPYDYWLAGTDVEVIYHVAELTEVTSQFSGREKPFTGHTLAKLRESPDYVDGELTVIDRKGVRRKISLERWSNADPEKTRLVLYQQYVLPPEKGTNYLVELLEKAVAAQESGASWPLPSEG